MPEDLFSFVSDELERCTALDRLEARGTLRLVLKESGLEPKTVNRAQFCVVLGNVAPPELENRGVAGAEAICKALIAKIHAEPADRWSTTRDVDEIFDRLSKK